MRYKDFFFFLLYFCEGLKLGQDPTRAQCYEYSFQPYLMEYFDIGYFWNRFKGYRFIITRAMYENLPIYEIN